MIDDARTPEWRETAGNIPTSRHDAIGSAVVDARTALSDRLERFVNGRWVSEDGPPRDILIEAIAVLRTPAPDLRTMADEMRHELFIVGNHPALGVDRVMVARWLRRLEAALVAHEANRGSAGLVIPSTATEEEQ